MPLDYEDQPDALEINDCAIVKALRKETNHFRKSPITSKNNQASLISLNFTN